MVEIVIVLLIIAILAVLALPQLMSSRRLLRFAGFQRETVAMMRDARQQAMAQRKSITFRYEDDNKAIVVYGAGYGVFGNPNNQVKFLEDTGVDLQDLAYGRPSGASAAALGDSTNLTGLTASAVEVTFQPDGSVINGSNNPVNKALFFYSADDPDGTAFAVSILGAGGRIKVWRYNPGGNSYIE